MQRTLVLQSHTEPLPAAWLAICLQSVRDWAERREFDYRFVGDELFDLLDDDLRLKTAGQPVVASDLARLLALRAALTAGYERVVWCDADVLCFAPARLDVPNSDFAVGREVWVQRRRARGSSLRAYVKVHNAFLVFCRHNSFLDFYIGAATRLLRHHTGPFAPQLVGPKWLTAIHNIAPCPVVEQAGMLSPLVLADLVRGDGPALSLLRERSHRPLAAANLCASLQRTGELDTPTVERAIERLLSAGL